MKQYLSFEVNSGLYLLDISMVNSIIKKNSNEVRPVPDTPRFFLGMSQLRDKTIGIMSASMMFDSRGLNNTQEYQIVVVDDKSELHGLVVDEVHGVKNIDEDTLKINNFVSNMSPYILSMYNGDDDGKIYLVVDIVRLFEIRSAELIKE